MARELARERLQLDAEQKWLTLQHLDTVHTLIEPKALASSYRLSDAGRIHLELSF